MSAFIPYLQSLSQRCPDVLVCSVMGLDGLSVETFSSVDVMEKYQLDSDALFVEFSTIVNRIQNRSVDLAMGEFEELSLQSKSFTCLIRRITSEYFLAIAVRAEGNVGKARYLARILAPEIKREL